MFRLIFQDGELQVLKEKLIKFEYFKNKIEHWNNNNNIIDLTTVKFQKNIVNNILIDHLNYNSSFPEYYDFFQPLEKFTLIDGKTITQAFKEAYESNKFELIKFIIDTYGYTIDVGNIWAYTVFYNNLKLAQLLIDHDIIIQTTHKYSTLAYALKLQHKDMFQLLSQNGFKLSVVSDFAYAVESNDIKLITYILEYPEIEYRYSHLKEKILDVRTYEAYKLLRLKFNSDIISQNRDYTWMYTTTNILATFDSQFTKEFNI